MKNALLYITLTVVFSLGQYAAQAGQVHDAAKRGDMPALRILVEAKPSIISALDEHRATALHWSAVKGHRDIADYLIGKGATVNQKNRDGDTALHLAVAFGHKDIVELLLQSGSNVDERRREGTTPLHVAVDRKRKDIAEILISYGADIDAQIQYGQMRGQTPLYRAAGKGSPDVAELLLSKGANPNISNKDGDTPLHIAAAYGNERIVRLLLTEDADPTAQSNDGTTPEQFAKRQGHSQIAQLIASQRHELKPEKTATSPTPSTQQSDAGAEDTTSDSEDGSGVFGIIALVVVAYLFFKYVIIRDRK